jgi:predicted Zn-dependent protease
MKSPRRALSGCLVLALACAGGGSSAPGSPRKVTVLMTESDEVRVGRQGAAEVAAQMGLLGDAALDAYVDGIGRKLLRGLPARGFDYQFKVVDQVEPNAFTLPGGFIFITRGLLLLTNSEDELACVIGHEITHAARHHAAAQQGEGPAISPWGAARNAAYDRGMERTADEGGQILCAAAGYDPKALASFLTTLGQAERLRAGYSRNPGFFDTHPGSQERAAAASVRASELRWTRSPSLGDPRAALLHHLDGLAVGERPEAGVFEGSVFLQPAMDFQIRFPPGWATANANLAVGAISPSRDAVVYLMGDPPTATGKEGADAWLAKMKEQGQHIEVKESVPVKVGHMDAWRLRVVVSSGGGWVTSYVTFIPYGPSTFRITGAAPSVRADDVLGTTLGTARSFAPLSDDQRRSIRSTRLRVATARPGEDLVALGHRSGNDWDPTTTAVYNGLFSDHRFAGGELVKISISEPYAPAMAHR